MKTKLVGIINVTPDSFSDGGNFVDPKKALAQAEKMANDGAYAIDIGAESTRPGAIPIFHEEEWNRLQSALKLIIKAKLPLKISVDTRHYETAIKSLNLGADWINDVSGFSDGRIIKAMLGNQAKLVAMHNLGVPADKNVILPEDKNPVSEVIKWAYGKIKELKNAGIKRERIIIDPGVGFGKNATQSLELINNAEKFRELGVEIMYGHSRKSFLAQFTSKPAYERDEETRYFSAILAAKGVDYLRVHDVRRQNVNL